MSDETITRVCGHETHKSHTAKHIEIKVLCNKGNYHYIRHKAGELNVQLLNHQDEDIPRLLNLAALGHACRCVIVYKAFRDHIIERLPPALAQRIKPYPAELAHEQKPGEPEEYARVRRVVLACLEKCSYRRSTNRYAGGRHIVTVNFKPAGGQPEASGFLSQVSRAAQTTSRHKRDIYGTNSYVNLTLPDDWYQSVYLPGYAIIYRRRRRLLVLGRHNNRSVWFAQPFGNFKMRAVSYPDINRLKFWKEE